MEELVDEMEGIDNHCFHQRVIHARIRTFVPGAHVSDIYQGIQLEPDRRGQVHGSGDSGSGL